MNYSLGNMLGGAGALNADKLSLDLQFAIDKTLTARKGPTPTFTRASTATFVGSDGLIQSAALNAARFDHDPVTLACKGLLIEEARTNSCIRSEDFSTTWVTYQSSVSANSTASPDGATSADSLVENFSTDFHSIYQPITFAALAYTFSIYAKAGNRNWISLFENTSGSSRRTFFNLSTGAIGTKNAAHTAAVQQLSNGWYRCQITFTSTSGGIQNVAVELASADNVGSYVGNGSGNVFIWGAQLEAGSFPTSYIPTVASSVVRSADVCSITGAAFTGMYNTTEGTFFATASTFSPNTNIRRIVFATDGAITNRAGLLFNSVGSPTTFVASSGGSLSALIAVTVASITSPVKIAGAYKLDDFAISANGSAVTTDTSGLVGVGINRLNIGSQNDTETLNGHIASIRYYKKRLSNAKLQTITV
jgi:hypothetical protein